MSGKQRGDACEERHTSPTVVSSRQSPVVVAAIRCSSATLKGKLGLTRTIWTDMMLDSGSTISLVRADVAAVVDCHRLQNTMLDVQVAGETIPVVDNVMISVGVDTYVVKQSFLVVKCLVTPVILGMDFLQAHGLIIDFSATPVKVVPRSLIKSTSSTSTNSSEFCLGTDVVEKTGSCR